MSNDLVIAPLELILAALERQNELLERIDNRLAHGNEHLEAAATELRGMLKGSVIGRMLGGVR